MPVVKFEFRLRIGSIKGNPDLTGKLRAAGFWIGGGMARQLDAPGAFFYSWRQSLTGGMIFEIS
jgi:hypothetical protein